MVQLSKSEIIPLIVAHYREQLQESTYQMYSLSQKYQCLFEDFEKLVNSKEEEDFELWDDYLLWKGHRASAKHLGNLIQEIEHGLFTLAS